MEGDACPSDMMMIKSIRGKFFIIYLPGTQRSHSSEPPCTSSCHSAALSSRCLRSSHWTRHKILSISLKSQFIIQLSALKKVQSCRSGFSEGAVLNSDSERSAKCYLPDFISCFCMSTHHSINHFYFPSTTTTKNKFT